MLRKKIEDKVIDYPEPENSGYPLKDKLFNWVVGRYKKNNHPWKVSDQRVWHGTIYGVSTYLGMLIFFGFMWWVVGITQKKFGDMRALYLLLLIIIVRVNILIRQMVSLNKKF